MYQVKFMYAAANMWVVSWEVGTACVNQKKYARILTKTKKSPATTFQKANVRGLKSEIRKTFDIWKQNCYTSIQHNILVFAKQAQIHKAERGRKMELFGFSWATITLIDIGVLSLSVIGLWWLKNQVDEYRALSEELKKQNNALQQKYETLQQEHNTLLLTHENLQQEFRNFQSTSDRRYNTLQEASEAQYNELQKEWEERYNTLQEASEARYNELRKEWETRYNTLQEASEAQYNELQEKWEAQYNELQEEHNALKGENETLRAGLDAITKEHKILERKYDTMAGRYQEISDKFTLILEKLADRN